MTSVFYSGSHAKGTAVKAGTDVDLFISLKSTTTNTLKDLYNSLYSYLDNHGYEPRKQNVSIGIVLDNVEIDLIPAKRQIVPLMFTVFGKINNKLGHKLIFLNIFVK